MRPPRACASSAAGGGARSASPAPRSITSTPRCEQLPLLLRDRARAGTRAACRSDRRASAALVRRVVTGLLHAAHAEHLHFYLVARREGPDAGGRAVRRVAGLERHDARDVGQHVGMSNTMSDACPRCRSSPFTRVSRRRATPRSSGAGPSSPTGQNVSNPLARVHCDVGLLQIARGHVVRRRTMSAIAPRASSARRLAQPSRRRRRRSPLRTPPAWTPSGRRWIRPSPIRLDGGLRKISGSFGTSLPSSLAWARVVAADADDLATGLRVGHAGKLTREATYPCQPSICRTRSP